MDKLSDVLTRFSVSAGVFYSGGLCGLVSFGETGADEGHLHLLKNGRLQVMDSERQITVLVAPSLVFIPRPSVHRLIADKADQAEIVCACIRYGTSSHNPLANALPPLLVLSLNGLGRLQGAVEWLFEEAFAKNSGRQVMMDRLTEVLLIQLLRHVVDSGMLTHGMLAGLAHPRLAHAIQAMHENPAKAWSLEELAALCALSRSKFAEEFRLPVGNSPGDYLIEWRVSVAQGFLKKGKPVGWVANEVGYENASALARVFRKKTGFTPRGWLRLLPKA